MNTGKEFTWSNTNGINTWGKPSTNVVIVEQGKVQPMWVGIDVPVNVIAGNYEGAITVKTGNSGDEETWRHCGP